MSKHEIFTTQNTDAGMIVVIGSKTYEYVARDSSIRNFDGSYVFRLDNALVPPAWGQTAVDILVQKYFRKAGVPLATELVAIEERGVFKKYQRQEPLVFDPTGGQETSAHQVFHRLAGCWTYWGIKSRYFTTLAEADEFYAECYDILYNQYAAPNSPQWFNTGLNWAYGISSPLAGAVAYYYDNTQGKVVESHTAYTRPQPHACFIQSLEDNLIGSNGILDLVHREAAVFKFGSGSGSNFSKLRGIGERLSGGGKSSGLMSFLKINDVAAGSIKSGGTSRRAAKMIIVDIDHPEIEAYIDWKVVEENKVAALASGSKLNKQLASSIYSAKTKKAYENAVSEAIKYGMPDGLIQRVIQARECNIPINLEEYGVDWESEAYQTVGGQNANNSVMITDKFLDCVKLDANWDLLARTDGSVMKTVKASHLWDKIASAAWMSADPGIEYYDNINNMNTCRNDEEIVGTNPCSEYIFLNDTACNLGSLNLGKIYNTFPSEFVYRLMRYARVWQTVLDISIEMAQLPSKALAYRTWQYRTTGLGYANIGSLMMQLGMAYGDARSCDFVEALTSLMTGTAYKTSAEYAAKLSPFPVFKRNKSSMMRVIGKHREFATALDKRSEGQYEGTDPLSEMMDDAIIRSKELWDEVEAFGEIDGFRNAFVSCNAPTGTIGLVMDCDTTGIEPDFALVKHKKLAGGGYIRIVNESVRPALTNLGYSKSEADAVIAYISGHKSLPYIEESQRAASLQYTTREDFLDLGVPEEMLRTTETLISTFYNLEGIVKHLEAQSNLDLSLILSDKTRVARTNSYLYGHGTVEGCTALRAEHQDIFLCAVPSGEGTRSISADGHLNVLAAAQKFVSGASSKTINLPFDATVDDIKYVYSRAHVLGIKAISVYRDGSKLSQPLKSSMVDTIKHAVNSLKLEEEPEATVAEVSAAVDSILPSLQRKRLPNRRTGGYLQKVAISGHKFYLSTGEYPDGRLGEIFITGNKEGTTLQGFLNALAIAVSISLQYGVPLEEFVEAFTFTKFEPAGPVVGHDNIKKTDSVLDYVFRDLAISYLQRDDLANVKPMREETVAKPTLLRSRTEKPVIVATPLKMIPIAEPVINNEDKKYTGETCSNCSSHRMVRTGTCSTCQECGTTSGC